jgi:hypothetical protein
MKGHFGPFGIAPQLANQPIGVDNALVVASPGSGVADLRARTRGVRAYLHRDVNTMHNSQKIAKGIMILHTPLKKSELSTMQLNATVGWPYRPQCRLNHAAGHLSHAT